MKRIWFLLILAVLFLSACAEPTFVAQVTETVVPTVTATVTLTPEPTATATRTPKPTKTLTPTMDPIMVPDWAKQTDSDLYLFRFNEKIILLNPATQEQYEIPLDFSRISGYFWLQEPEVGIGWTYRASRDYDTLDFLTGNVKRYQLSDNARYFMAQSVEWAYSQWGHDAVPLKLVKTGPGDTFFVGFSTRYSIEHNATTPLSPDEHYFVLNTDVGDGSTDVFTVITIYDLVKEEEIIFEVPGEVYSSWINWAPDNSGWLMARNVLLDIITGSTKEIQLEGCSRSWYSGSKSIIYNPLCAYSWHIYDDGEELTGQINVYSIPDQVEYRLTAIDKFFKEDPFELKKEEFYNLTYIPSLDILGFSYYGLGTAEGYEMDTAGGYCLYSFKTGKVNCITDEIEEMLVVLDEVVNYTAREEVVYTQWSVSNRFLAFHVRRGGPGWDDPDIARLLIYDLETGVYYHIDNYSEEPLGVWSP